jgi:hypothetical protein
VLMGADDSSSIAMMLRQGANSRVQ